MSLSLAGGAFAQTGSKPVDLKAIVDGHFRQKTSVGEMRSLPDGEYYTAMNPERDMIVKYAYRTGEPVDTLFNTKTARECTFDDFDGYTIRRQRRSIAARARWWSTTTTCAAIT